MDYDTDHIIDLYKQYEMEQSSSDEASVFIRMLSIDPFMVVHFTEEQIKFLGRLRNCTKGQVVAHIDSTGNIIEDLPAAIKGSEAYVYSIVVSSPLENSAPFPVGEFITTLHDTESLASGLEVFHAS